MIENNNEFMDRLLSKMTQPLPQTQYVKTLKSNIIQFNGKQKVVPLQEIREHAPIISGCTREQLDRLVAQDQALSTAKTVTEFEERMKKFEEYKLLGLTQQI